MNTKDQQTKRPRKERTANAEKRRRQLIDATLRSIVANGLSKTTLATVAREAGLSEGVAVFYFKTKDKLLAEALRAHYEAYTENWQRELEQAGADPVARLTALVRADFSDAVCNHATLSVWHAFWGDAKAHPLYAEISDSYDAQRMTEMTATCAQLLPDAPQAWVAQVALGIEALTDGLWQRMYITPDEIDARRGTETAFAFLKLIFPSHSAHWS